jgi:hypothetical protein
MTEGFDSDVPSPARMYDYYLGGRDNFAADREAAEAVIAGHPEQRQLARNNRTFLVRAVEHLAAAGITPFVDIGTGIPTSPTVHRSRAAPTPTPASCTSTTTPWCSRTRGRCSPRTPRSPWSTPTCTTPTSSPSTPTWRS